MALSNGPNLGLLVNAAQGEAHFAAQQQLLRGLDALVQPSVKDKDLATPPGSPADGDRYIVAAAPTGAWVGHAAEIARWSSVATAWEFYVPKAGWRMYVVDEAVVYTYTGAIWSATVARKMSFSSVLDNVNRSTGSPSAFWPDAETNIVEFNFQVPGDYVSGDLTIKVFRRGGATNTARMRWQAFRFRNATGVFTAIAFTDVNFTPGDVNSHVLSMAIDAADFQAGDTIRVDLERLGLDAADTMTAAVSYDGGWVEYTGRA